MGLCPRPHSTPLQHLSNPIVKHKHLDGRHARSGRKRLDVLKRERSAFANPTSLTAERSCLHACAKGFEFGYFSAHLSCSE